MENIHNTIELITIGKLSIQENKEPKYKFLIPSYQRGYRWSDDEVLDLLNDIHEFMNTKKDNQKYCLQPIVVKKLEDGRYEVLDGQQRLTTIFILLNRLKKEIPNIKTFQIEYETRKNSQEFLSTENISNGVNDENPDYYYISKAYNTVNDWITGKIDLDQGIICELHLTIFKSVEFIWYEIKEDTDAIDVFTRINIGKIRLTNSELVKAIFLSKNNLSIGAVGNNLGNDDYNKILTFK